MAGLLLYSLTVDVELARQQWEDGNRRVEDARRGDGRHYARLAAEVELVLRALNQRVGQTYTLAELAAAYDGADDWARDLLQDADPEERPSPEAGTVADAAFHLYARGAADYRP